MGVRVTTARSVYQNAGNGTAPRPYSQHHPPQTVPHQFIVTLFEASPQHIAVLVHAHPNLTANPPRGNELLTGKQPQKGAPKYSRKLSF